MEIILNATLAGGVAMPGLYGAIVSAIVIAGNESNGDL